MSSTISSDSIVRQLKTCFMRLPHVDRIHGRLSDLAGYVCGAEEPDHLFVIGETGTGKSTLLIRFAAGFGRIEHESCTEIPVLYAQVPSRCTIKRLATILLRQMGSPFYNRGDEEDRTHQLITLLRACKVRVVILDEVNHLIDRGGRITHYAVGDWIKQTFDLASVSCVLAGTPRSTLLLDTNEQMADRFREIVKLPTFSIETPEETKDLQRMLKAFRKQLGDLPSVDFSGGTLPAQILFATGGRFRDVKRLLSRAVEIAFQEDAPTLRIECFARAFSEVIFVDAEAKRNPFLPEFNGLPLTQPGEPFAKLRA